MQKFTPEEIKKMQDTMKLIQGGLNRSPEGASGGSLLSDGSQLLGLLTTATEWLKAHKDEIHLDLLLEEAIPILKQQLRPLAEELHDSVEAGAARRAELVQSLVEAYGLSERLAWDIVQASDPLSKFGEALDKAGTAAKASANRD